MSQEKTQSELDVDWDYIGQYEECDDCIVYRDGEKCIAVDLCQDHSSTSETAEGWSA